MNRQRRTAATKIREDTKLPARSLALLLLLPCCCAASSVAPPVPTAAQLAYQEAEIVAIVCFQMDTYAGTDGDPGCTNPTEKAQMAGSSSCTNHRIMTSLAKGTLDFR